MGTPPSSSDAPDGEVVEKGGVAQQIRTAHASDQGGRKVFTCLACAANTPLATTPTTQFSTTNLTASQLGVGSVGERDALVHWVRGTDNAGDERGPGAPVTVRPSVHGDVLHSRPAVVNYGGSTGVVVFYGANDGLLRAVNGNPSGTGAGSELWAFVAAEHLPRLKRLRQNAPEIRLSTTLMSTPLTASSPTPRDYFVDGPISVYQKLGTDGSSERVIVYASMRRGGRELYALDVTEPTQPVFLWKKTPADLSVLGQTWSEPKLGRIKGHTGPVLIMGAGYDAAAEDLPTPGSSTMGNAVLVLDAISGALLRQFSTERSVPADVALVDADFDGYVDRAYAVDVGGALYRLDFETGTSSLPAAWGMFKLASLAGGQVRKFFYAPDVIVTPQYAAVLAGSGDREKPLATTSADAFFTVYDRLTTKGTPAAFTPIAASSLGIIGAADDKTAGCYWPLSTAGEKVVNAPVTVAGITYFSTNRPTPSGSSATCSPNLGEARVYALPLFCKVPDSQKLIGGGLPPSPVAGTVLVQYTENGVVRERRMPFIIGAPNSKASPIEGSKVKPTIAPVRKRRYWYQENAR
jgi:type IV pilus assembly protein PilY1